MFGDPSLFSASMIAGGTAGGGFAAFRSAGASIPSVGTGEIRRDDHSGPWKSRDLGLPLPICFGSEDGWRGIKGIGEQEGAAVLEMVYRDYPITFSRLWCYSMRFRTDYCRVLGECLLFLCNIHLGDVDLGLLASYADMVEDCSDKLNLA